MVDVVVLFVLSVIFVYVVCDFGFKDKKVIELIVKVGSLSVVLEVMIYFGFVFFGVMSLNKMFLLENGGIVFF